MQNVYNMIIIRLLLILLTCRALLFMDNKMIDCLLIKNLSVSRFMKTQILLPHGGGMYEKSMKKTYSYIEMGKGKRIWRNRGRI